MKFLDTTLYLVTIKYMASPPKLDEKGYPIESEESVYVLGDYISDLLDTMELEPIEEGVIYSFKAEVIRIGLFDGRHSEP